jgi:hypothetical protein
LQKSKQPKQLLNNPALLFRLLERAAFADRIATSFFSLVGEAEESAPRVYRATIFISRLQRRSRSLTCAFDL